MRRIHAVVLAICLFSSLILSGCGGATHGLDPKKPVTLTMWHNFGGEMQKAMDDLIDEFNRTVGKDQGIIISVTAVSSSAELQETLNMILNGDPGAPEMPDITTSYPKTAVLFQAKGMLANLDRYFTANELAAYVPAFIAEGRLGDNGLYVFPFAKSTEVLYLNQTLFDRFAAAAGMTMACLDTFEGIAEAAQKYYKWTDAQTPDIPDDGKQFFAADSWLNLAQAGMLQQGSSLFFDEALNLNNDAYARIWKTCYTPSVTGGFAVYDGYSSDLSKTGDIVCSVGSSAGILFYGDTVAYPDNTVEKVEYNILPYPVFAGGKKVAIQRGNGFCVAASNETREYAASVFLKWLTQPEQNMRFAAATGYLPVTTEAFGRGMPEHMTTVADANIRKMLETVMKMQAEYDFFVAPTFEDYDSLSKDYESRYTALLTSERETWLTGNEGASVAECGDTALRNFIMGK